MFRHRGKNRSFIHNRRLASQLSFIAGSVNICGILSINTLTTNITGHVAFMTEELVKENYRSSIIFFLYLLCFLLGAFTSNMFVEILIRYRPRLYHSIPILLEILILAFAGLAGGELLSGQWLACMLLFAMGLQNSLVTQVSNSIVRTTHLTGLFTDLGIELSQLLFYKGSNLVKLRRSINLRITIIFFFTLGGVLAGYTFQLFGIKTLALVAGLLVLTLFYDLIRFRYYLIRRRIFSRSKK
ncbi:MAG TPA: YoaK family protein [Cytophagaceae bacterium]